MKRSESPAAHRAVSPRVNDTQRLVEASIVVRPTNRVPLTAAILIQLSIAFAMSVQAQQVKPTTASNQPNAKASVNETSSSTSEHGDISLIKQIVWFPVRVGKSVLGNFVSRKAKKPSELEESSALLRFEGTPPESTKILRITIDKKETKKDYRVFVYMKGKELEAKRTKDGFVIPDELREKENVALRILIGKYDLEFGQIPSSKFKLDWTLGIDTKPFDEGRVTDEEAKGIKYVYFLQYGGTELIGKVNKEH